jgi:hypothetical protein
MKQDLNPYKGQFSNRERYHFNDEETSTLVLVTAQRKFTMLGRLASETVAQRWMREEAKRVPSMGRVLS